MATKYGKTSRRITPSDISSVTVNNMTLISSGSDARGGYFYSGYVNTGAGGCGAGVEPSIFINIKNTALNNWRVITFKTFGTFTASCWSLNVSSWANNILAMDTSLGDGFSRSTNCFELSQFTKQTSACDNEPTHFILAFMSEHSENFIKPEEEILYQLKLVLLCNYHVIQQALHQ
jgi:hypothetical protein